MEIQGSSFAYLNHLPPVRPLQGYFRFRQEMMNLLSEEKRSSEVIICLWNNLTQQQKVARRQQALLEQCQYQIQLNCWKKNQQIPLRTTENTLHLKDDIIQQQKIEQTLQIGTGISLSLKDQKLAQKQKGIKKSSRVFVKKFSGQFKK